MRPPNAAHSRGSAWRSPRSCCSRSTSPRQSGSKPGSADLTQDRLFTISEGTREILNSIDEPISARLYFSRNLAAASPDVARYFDRVRTLFEQYRDISGGKLQLAILDPEPFSDAEDKAVAAGLRGLRLNAEGEVGYFGLVASNATDNQQTIPFFSPDRESFLEYDVTKLIYALANPKKRTVGLMTSLPLDGGKSPMRDQATQPRLIMEQIRDFFDVRTVDQDVKEIPADIDVLMVAQPTQLTPEAAYAIDQYALKGGKVLAFVDPVSESAQMQLLQKQGDGRKEFDKVLKGWGVDFDSKQVAADIRHARRVQFGGGQGGEGMVTDFVAWLGLDKTGINPNDVLSAGIDEINLASAGVLTEGRRVAGRFLADFRNEHRRGGRRLRQGRLWRRPTGAVAQLRRGRSQTGSGRKAFGRGQVGIPGWCAEAGTCRR